MKTSVWDLKNEQYDFFALPINLTKQTVMFSLNHLSEKMYYVYINYDQNVKDIDMDDSVITAL